MILRYTPQSGAAIMWDLDQVRFLTSEAETIERTTDMEWSDVISRGTLLFRKSPTARRAVTWVLLKRTEPTLRYSAFDPAIDEISVKLSGADLAELRAEADAQLAAGKATPEEVAEGLAELEELTDPVELARLREQEAAGPKAPEQAPVLDLASEPEGSALTA
ncbi:hypothetical protein ACIQNU_03330 [Streptomyces sp. NPDC091292]|uniref:hypothetical protein n=1 Tax=Streptomyces sp. NPDC091292 TaxID=3365991 RepID=UPI00381E39E4